jgi:hypothetical protein
MNFNCWDLLKKLMGCGMEMEILFSVFPKDPLDWKKDCNEQPEQMLH